MRERMVKNFISAVLSTCANNITVYNTEHTVLPLLTAILDRRKILAQEFTTLSAIVSIGREREREWV